MSLAFVFPGQGSQSVGMLNNLAEGYVTTRNTFLEASDALGFDLWKLVTDGPEDELNKTSNTQPAMLAAGVAVWRVWLEAGGIRPVIMAGHSLGEYTALVCAGAMEFADSVKLVHDRGMFMQEAVPAGQGAMAAILGLEDDVVISTCEEAAQNEVVSAVNFNSPGQVVIAGQTAAVERAVALATEKGAKRAVMLPVSVPSHCSLMHAAAEKMAQRLNDVPVQSPAIPVIHNVSVRTESDPSAIREALIQQIEKPVRWVESIEAMANEGVSDIIECGPGRVLAGLNKRITKTVKTHPVYDAETLAKAIEVTRQNG